MHSCGRVARLTCRGTTTTHVIPLNELSAHACGDDLGGVRGGFSPNACGDDTEQIAKSLLVRHCMAGMSFHTATNPPSSNQERSQWPEKAQHHSSNLPLRRPITLQTVTFQPPPIVMVTAR